MSLALWKNWHCGSRSHCAVARLHCCHPEQPCIKVMQVRHGCRGHVVGPQRDGCAAGQSQRRGGGLRAYMCAYACGGGLWGAVSCETVCMRGRGGGHGVWGVAWVKSESTRYTNSLLCSSAGYPCRHNRLPYEQAARLVRRRARCATAHGQTARPLGLGATVETPKQNWL